MLNANILLILLSGPVAMLLSGMLIWLVSRRLPDYRREQLYALTLLGCLCLQPLWLEPFVHGKVLQHRDWQFALLAAAFLIWNGGRRSPERNAPVVFYWHTLACCLGLWLIAAVTIWPDLWMLHTAVLGAGAALRALLQYWRPDRLTVCLGWPVGLLLLIQLLEAMQAGFPAATLLAASPMLWHAALAVAPLPPHWQPRLPLWLLGQCYLLAWALGWWVLNHDLAAWQGFITLFGWLGLVSFLPLALKRPGKAGLSVMDPL